MRLPSVLGNDRLKREVERLASPLSSSLMIEGPRGSGRKTAAFDIAMGALCRGKNAPCGVCASCRKMRVGSHPDYSMLAFQGKAVKLDAVREFRALSFIKPNEAEQKILVVDEADRLGPEAQNVLLKVLEEPQNTLFILICQNREALLQTIRSRCMCYRMEPLGRDELMRALERTGADRQRIDEAAERSGGILGVALELLEHEPSRAQLAAEAFARSLGRGELEMYRGTLPLSALPREELPEFYDEACIMLRNRADTADAGAAVDIYEYLVKQRSTLERNPSQVALAGALAAFCAQVFGGKNG